MSGDRSQVLREHNVIPDVLSEGTSLSHSLKVVFPEATLDTPGEELGREETQPEPKLYIDPVVRFLYPIFLADNAPANNSQPQEKHTDYILLLTDPVRAFQLQSNN